MSERLKRRERLSDFFDVIQQVTFKSYLLFIEGFTTVSVTHDDTLKVI